MEYEVRRAAFEASLKEVAAHNNLEGQTWYKAINRFSDMTPSEFKKMVGGRVHGKERIDIPANQSN